MIRVFQRNADERPIEVSAIQLQCRLSFSLSGQLRDANFVITLTDLARHIHKSDRWTIRIFTRLEGDIPDCTVLGIQLWH